MDFRGKVLLFSSMITLGVLFGVIFHFLLMPLLQGIAYCLVSAILLQVVNYTLYGRMRRRISRNRALKLSLSQYNTELNN